MTESGTRAGAPPQLRPAPGLHLFVLDDGGVVYDDVAQEIHALDAQGTLLWITLEPGATCTELARTLRGKIGCSEAEAVARTDAILAAWSARNWLSQGVSELAARGSERSGARSDAGAPWPDEIPPMGSNVRCYRILSSKVDVEVDDDATWPLVGPCLIHLARKPGDAPDVVLGIRRVGAKFEVTLNGQPSDGGVAPGELVPIVKLRLRQIAVTRHRFFMNVHAGAVLGRDGVWLLPGDPGSGKTTLTTGLVYAGLRLLSDEVVLLEPDSLRVRPVPLALTVKSGAVAPLSGRHPELESLPVHLREDGRRVRYLPPARDAIAPDVAGGHPVRGILFPKYAEGAGVSLTPVRRMDALQGLLASCLTLPEWLSVERVAHMVGWMRGLETWRLEMGDLGDAVSKVVSMTGRG
jgi:hypothetical protein